ncbi:hypothetical protein ACWCRF_35855 [Streptomyces sp. NPDC002405]|uniref:hypothetical protein n=1 Tax=Streptomyces sp. NPDC057596 TaxID=3346178 RepID=UPI0036C8C3F5
MLAGRDRTDPRVGAVRVRDQEQAFEEFRLADGLTGADRGEGLEHPGTQGGLFEDVDQGDDS